MMPVPDVQMPTPSAARDLIAAIRSEGRPRLLNELARLYEGDERDVMVRAGILATEIQLQKLDQQLDSLLRIAASGSSAFGWESFSPQVRGLGRPGPGQVEACVDLAFSLENRECVHGPSTVVAVGSVARHLLMPGESLAAVSSITFAAPLRHRIRLRVWDAAGDASTQPKAALSGRLGTSSGRVLAFAADPDERHPLLAQRGYNLLSQALTVGRYLVFSPDRTSVSLELSDDGLAACRRAVAQRPELAAALLLDLVPLAILTWKRGRPMMACGYRDVPLPAPPAVAFAPGTRLEVRYDRDKSHASSRSGLWIGRYEFRYAPRQATWSTMVMAEADDIRTLFRRIHS